MSERVNPGVDPEVWERMLPAHEADIAAANEFDPNSVFYKRPDLVRRHVETAEAAFADICRRAVEHQRARDATNTSRRTFAGASHRS